uniref:Beta-defensin-like domain-containing protein n=1 Tax=Chrysemys picta bellii TaxID=8478 RepID=A0A8C3I508_CHRPI
MSHDNGIHLKLVAFSFRRWGFTQFIDKRRACIFSGGFCRGRCPPNFRRIGSCSFGQSCSFSIKKTAILIPL